MEDLVKNLQSKNDEIREKLKAYASWEEELRSAKASTEEEEMRTEVKVKLDSAEIQVNG